MKKSKNRFFSTETTIIAQCSVFRFLIKKLRIRFSLTLRLDKLLYATNLIIIMFVMHSSLNKIKETANSTKKCVEKKKSNSSHFSLTFVSVQLSQTDLLLFKVTSGSGIRMWRIISPQVEIEKGQHGLLQRY